jgi:hypothetical protein
VHLFWDAFLQLSAYIDLDLFWISHFLLPMLLTSCRSWASVWGYSYLPDQMWIASFLQGAPPWDHSSVPRMVPLLWISLGRCSLCICVWSWMSSRNISKH